MKQNNPKKPNLSVKKSSAKGAGLKSLKDKIPNPKHQITNKSQIPSTCVQGASASGGSPLPKGEGRVRVFNFKRWHKLSAAFASIAIIGIVVFYQFAPENARSKTFTMMQTAWSIVAATVNLGECDSGSNDPYCAESGDQRNVTAYDSKDTPQIDVSSGTDVTLTATPGSKPQTNDGTTETGFNLSGSSTSSTIISGSGDPATIKLGDVGWQEEP